MKAKRLPPGSVQKWFVALTATVIALLIAVVILAYIVLRGSAGAGDLRALMNDPEVKEQAIARLVKRGGGIWDSHVDADVGRVLQAGLEGREFRNKPLSSNRFGLREKEYQTPKPPGMLRVVLLGDSFVFGEGVTREDRIGVFLERYLKEKGQGSPTQIEVLHIGIGSWNVLAECAYLRRQLSLIQPDLVLHFTTANDLDDMDGVRGFGAKARFSPQRRERADGRILLTHPTWYMGLGETNHLLSGLGWESRERHREAAEAIGRLRSAVESQGGRYAMVMHWGIYNGLVMRDLQRFLDEDQFVFLSLEFSKESLYWVALDDSHWNRSGMERLAKMFYALARQRAWLPMLQLEAWPEADQIVADIHDVGLADAKKQPRVKAWLESRPLTGRLDFTQLDDELGRHILGGIDKDGHVAPYAAVLMRAKATGNVLHIEGNHLERPEIDGAQVQVLVEGQRVGTFEVQAGQPIDVRFPIPDDLTQPTFIAVQFVSSDYAYIGHDLQHCASFSLTQLTLEDR